MPIPSNALPRPDLGQLAYERSMAASEQGFIADQVLPIFETEEKTAQYPFIPEAAVIEALDTQRAPRSAYQRSDWVFDFKNFDCKEHGFEEPLDDSEAKLYRRFFDAEVVTTERAMVMVLRDREIRVAAKVFDTGTFAPHAAAKKWDSYADANPLADVVAGKRALRKKGIKPNALILNVDTLQDLSLCSAVLERIKYTNPNVERGEIPAPLLAAYFGVERIIAAGGVYNAGAKGKPVDAKDIWDPSMAMLARVSSGGQDLREAALGRTFLWTADSPQNVMVEQYREEQTRSTIYRARQHTGEVIQFTGAGYLLTGIK